MEHNAQPRDRLGGATPMRCPVTDAVLENVIIRNLGGVTADITWEVHAGYSPAIDCWFQAEVTGRPPREIFPVNRPFGSARRLMVDGKEHYAFPTIWNTLSPKEQRSLKVDPLDWRYWQIARSAPTG